MYHHHSQPQGPPPFSNAPRPPQLPHNQHQNCTSPGMMSQTDFQFPASTQLPNKLQSGLTMHGARDVDHRPVDSKDMPNQHQGQGSSYGMGQHGSYRSNPATFTSDDHSGHQPGMSWSSYASPSKMFIPPPHSGHVPQNTVQKHQSSHTGTRIPSWTGPAAKHLLPRGGGGGGGGGGDGQSFYTAESAGSILASFGLSNDDLEVLSHYPDDQLTPDTLPFILRDIQINKSGDPKTTAATAAPSFSRPVQKLTPSSSSPLTHPQSPDVPSLLTVTQTAGKVIDYGHASRAKEEPDSRETFKREQLSSEGRVKLYSLASTFPKGDKTERQQVHLKHNSSGKHGDQDYRRTDGDHRKSSRSPGREFPPSSKSRNLDRDYRCDGAKLRPSPKRRAEESLRRSDPKLHGSNKRLPTPTMIRDFSSVGPKVYPHTCSLCHIQCDQDKDWVDHINTVNHISACRDLRNKFPDWKADFQSRSGRYGSRTLWDPRDHSSAHSRPQSYSPSRSPPQNTHREGPHASRPYRRPYTPQHHPQYRQDPGGPLHPRGKRPYDYVSKSPGAEGHHPPAKVGHGARHDALPASKDAVKPKSKTGKLSSAKAANLSAKPPPEKKKKVGTAASQHAAVSDRLVYLTGIPKDASEEEVTSLVGSFGKINNVILLPASGEQSDAEEGQKASVCMVKPEDAQSLACSAELLIRQQKLTASVVKKPEGTPASDASNSKNSAEGKNDVRMSENGLVLISGLPEGEWSEADIETLVQPFGAPSGMILAKQIGKVLVYVPNKDVAEEMVKVNNFLPMKFDSYHLKMSHIKQSISLSTPVALYNALMAPTDQADSCAQVGWSSLLVIQNVPHASHGSSEVQKLVRRFGTVIRSLVLHNMVICEMATAAMAMSVYKRFQAFPCIIQNNPLIFTRKADPKITQSRTVSAPQQPPENKIQDCEVETEEKKPDGSKEENHPEGENAKLSPANPHAPPPELAMPESPKNVTQEVEKLLSDGGRTRPGSQSSAATASDGGEDTEDKQVRVTAEGSPEDAEGPETQEKEQKEKETRKEDDARVHRERDRRSWEKEKVQRDRDRTERARRERERREEKRREGARTDRKSTDVVRSSSKSGKDEKQSSSSAEASRMDTEEDFDPFPINLSDFVTVDEVGDVADLPLPPSPAPAMETSPAGGPPTPVASVTADAADATVGPDPPTAACEPTPPEQVSPWDSGQTKPTDEPPALTGSEPATESCEGGQPPASAPPEEGEHASHSSAPRPDTPQNQEVNSLLPKEEQEEEGGPVKDPNGDVTRVEGSAKKAADEAKGGGRWVEEDVNAASPHDHPPLPPFNPLQPVGMEFLAPKTGFFCKVCNRFFSGAKEAEIVHCKTRKHYDNVKMYLQTRATGNASVI